MRQPLAIIKFNCPTCGGRVSAGPEHYATCAPCPHCGKLLNVPEIIENDDADPTGITADGYRVSIAGETKGPFTLHQLRQMWNVGTLTMADFYCEGDSEELLPLRDIQAILEPAPPLPQLAAVQTDYRPRMVIAAKSRGIYMILGLFLGILRIHDYYAGYHGRGTAQLLITLLTGWLILPLVIVLIWLLIDLVTVTKDVHGVRMH